MLSDQWCISSSWQTQWEFWCMDSELIWTNEGKDTADWHISMSYKSLSPFQRNFNQDLRNVCLPECALDEFQALDTSGDVSVITIGFGVLSSDSQHLYWWVQLDLTYWKCKEWRQNKSTWVKLVYDIVFFCGTSYAGYISDRFFFLFVSLDINGSTDGWGLEHLKSLGAIDWLVGSFMGKLCRTWRFQMWSFLVASTTFDMKMSKHSLRQPYWPHLSMVSWDDFTLHSTLVEVEKSPFQMILQVNWQSNFHWTVGNVSNKISWIETRECPILAATFTLTGHNSQLDVKRKDAPWILRHQVVKHLLLFGFCFRNMFTFFFPCFVSIFSGSCYDFLLDLSWWVQQISPLLQVG